MLLGKSCRSEFHIKKGTLKLGTLYEYRTIENEELIDRHEGMLEFHINFHGRVRLPTYWYNTFSGGGIGFGNGARMEFPGRTNGIYDTVKAKCISDSEIELYESRATIQREALNSFIFCMSKVRRTSECHGIFEGCDDYWYIRETQIRSFAILTARLLLEHIRKKHLEGVYILPKDTDVDRLEIAAEWAEVQYLSREIHVYKNEFMKLEEFSKKIQNMAFTKPDSYATEKEFRFNFVPVVDKKVIEPLVKSVILDSSELLSHVFWM